MACPHVLASPYWPLGAVEEEGAEVVADSFEPRFSRSLAPQQGFPREW